MPFQMASFSEELIEGFHGDYTSVNALIDANPTTLDVVFAQGNAQLAKGRLLLMMGKNPEIRAALGPYKDRTIVGPQNTKAYMCRKGTKYLVGIRAMAMQETDRKRVPCFRMMMTQLEGPHGEIVQVAQIIKTLELAWDNPSSYVSDCVKTKPKT